MLLIPIASDMVSLVLPLISEQFGASTAEVAWVVTGFLLACAVGIPVYGRVADRLSVRRLFTVALALFAVGSVICAVAPGLVVLVIGRIAMGGGGAAIPVLAIVAATRLLPTDKTAVGVGFIAAAGGVGTAAGPAVGGVIGQMLGWPALFWLMAFGAGALIPAVRHVIADEPPADRTRFDLLGGALLGLGAGLLLFGVTQVDSVGPGSPWSWGVVLAGVVFVILFVWRTRAVAHAFVPPALFAHPGYVAALVVIFLAMVVNLATLVLVPLLVIDVNGLTPGQGSLVMVPGGLALAVLSPLAGRLGGRGANEGTVVFVGLAVIGLAMLFLSTVAAGALPVLAGLAVVGLGVGFAFVVTLATSAVSRILPAQQVGIGVGVFQGAQFLGAGAGPALFGALHSARQASGWAVNPFHVHDASAYSDTFLALTAVVLVAMVAALRLRRQRRRRGTGIERDASVERDADAGVLRRAR